MTKGRTVRLSVLRDLGWTHWDPIGLLAEGELWDGAPCADEYDTYLLHAVEMLRDGVADEAIVDYFVRCDAEIMGYGDRGHTRSRAEALVKALRETEDEWLVSD